MQVEHFSRFAGLRAAAEISEKERLGRRKKDSKTKEETKENTEEASHHAPFEV